MDADKAAVAYELPVVNGLPPVLLIYHPTVPALGVAASVTEPDPQRLAGVVPVIVGGEL